MKRGATPALLPLLTDGEWHPLGDLAKVLEPFVDVKDPDPESVASSMASGMRCERMGLRGRKDQQIRWRPDFYLESEKGEARVNFTMGNDAVLKGLLGLRSFQQLLVQPGQNLNPAQRYWLDRALAMTKDHIAEGG